MKKSEKEAIREFVERWKRVGPELEAIRRKELAEFDHAANWEAIDGLLEAGLRFASPRKTSGLVEMQKWFMKLAERQGLRGPRIRERPARYGVPRLRARRSGGRRPPSRAVSKEHSRSS